MNKRSREKHGDNGSQAYLCAEEKSQGYAEHIAAYTTELKFNRSVLGQIQSYCVIDGYPHICGKIESGRQTHDRDADDQHHQTEEESSVWEKPCQKPGEKFCDITQQEHIDNCSQTNFFSVCDQYKDE